MKTRILTLILTVSGALSVLTGCGAGIIGSGNLVTETYDYAGFTAIEAHNGFEVEVIRSDSYGIEVTTDDNVQEYLDVKQSGDTLVIQLSWSRSYTGITIRAKVTMPGIERIELSGGSRGSITGFSSDDSFSVTMSGGSRLEGDIECGDIGFGLSGGSVVNLTGSGNNLMARSSGGSKITMDSFPVHDADINISGGGSATLDLSGRLDTDLSGGSKIYYSGEPEMGYVNLSGGSVLQKR